VALTPALTFREFAAEQSIRSLCTQNQSCSPSKESSNDAQYVYIYLKNKTFIAIFLSTSPNQ
jgi:hypothetical protein